MNYNATVTLHETTTIKRKQLSGHVAWDTR